MADPGLQAQQQPKAQEQVPEQQVLPMFTPPAAGESITSSITGNTYWIGDKIGEGAFGIVFECKDSWDNELAVKVLKPRGTYEDVRGRAIHEFEKLIQLRHPNVTFMHDAFEYRHTFYIVVERCSSSIIDLMNRANFKGHIWLKPLARCILQAVHFLHINNFAHQDIHAGNVFVSWQRDELVPAEASITFKLGDLGIAKLVSEMNVENTVLADWMRAPESLNHADFGPMDQRMDLYHCGLLFLQVLMGRQHTYSQDEILAGKPRADALTLSHPYSFAIEKALRRHVPYRTATAMEFWRDLNSPPTDVPT